MSFFHLLPIDRGQFIRSVGWQRLLDVSEDLDAVRVGQRCVRLMTLRLPPPDSALALVGRQEELEAEEFFFSKEMFVSWYLVDLRGIIVFFGLSSQVVLGMTSEKKRFDEADKLTLRCLMRRFGWEKNSQCSSKSSRCLWAETFQNCTVKEYKDFAWFLVEELLHPWCTADVQRSHWPEDIHRARNGAEGVHTDVVKLHDDLLLWQAENECTKLPRRGQDAALSRRIERYLTESKLHSKEKLERVFALESLRRGSLSMSAEKCPHMDGVPDRGEAVPWRSEFERDLMFQIPGWCEESLPKESFVPTVEMLPMGTNPVAVEVLQYLGDATVSFDRKLLAVARKLGCAADWLHVSEALSKLLLHQYIDDSEILDRYNCRLCGFGCDSEVKFLQHLESTHAASMSKQRAMVEYRKKVLGMSAFAGPTVAWTMVLSTFLVLCRVFTT